MGHLGAVFYKIEGEFLGQFFLPLQEVFLHKIESKYFLSKEFDQECLKVIFLSFPPLLSSLFFSQTLEQPIDIFIL